jgi:hypothetical protein
MKKVSLAKNTFEIPTNFSECSVGQISHILASQVYLHEALIVGDAETVERTKFSILHRLAPTMNMADYNKLNPNQKVSLYQVIRWAFTARIETKPFDSFEVDSIEYFIPADKFSDTTSLEFALCNIYYLAYTKHNIKPMFHNLLATICRPKRKDIAEFESNPEKYNGDKREQYNGVLATERAKQFEANAPVGLLIAVYQYWENLNNDFVNRHKNLFDGDDETKPLFQNGEGWLSMLEDIAENNIMGNIDQVYTTPVGNLFMYLNHKQVKLRAAEKEAERQRNKNEESL